MLKKLLPLLALALMIGATPASACLWDDDTLAQEAEGIEDEFSVIVGGFPRNPAKYYEMRLERAEAAIKKNAEDWKAYDNAGVSCDRLGKYDQAIAFMDAKLKAMQDSGLDLSKMKQPNHFYRYYANLGTFYAHRWLKNGKDRSKLDDITKAEKLITKAIKENPDAHFGREIYQLKAIKWLLKGDSHTPTFSKYKSPQSYYPDIMGLNSIKLANDKDKAAVAKQNKELDAMMKGLAGLMKMGNAWRSIDVLYAMQSIAAIQHKSSLAICIKERIKELKKEGLGLMISTTPSDAERKQGIKHRWRMRDAYEMPRQDVPKLYQKARKEVKDWHKARSDYMKKMLDANQHPDTHQDFWKAFKGGKPHGIKVSLGGKKGGAQPADGQKRNSPANGAPKSRANRAPSEDSDSREGHSNGDWSDEPNKSQEQEERQTPKKEQKQKRKSLGK